MSRMTSAIAVFVCLVIGSACDDSPTSPTNQVTLTAQLSPVNEVPPVTNADSSGSGTVTIMLNLTRDSAGTITAATADFDVSLTGFPPATILTAAHIHPGGVGVNGAPLVDTGLTTGQVVLTSGTGTLSRDGISVTGANAQNLISSPTNFYFNVHTALNVTGAVRGQLVRQ